MDKFRNRYRIQSARLPNWDYGWNASYFITLCTKDRECFFGKIADGKMVFSEIGNLANEFLIEIPERYEYALMDVYIVMPNHIHTIITVNKNDDRRGDGGRDNTPDGVRGDTHDGVPGDGGRGGCGRDAINRVSTVNPSNPKKRGGITGKKNPMLHDNISRIFNWYTGRVTYESRKINRNFAWQPRFYDHITRNDQEYQRIKKYIINNPGNWNDDSLHPG